MNKVDINKRLKEGDPIAFEGLFKVTHARLMSYCRLFVADHSIADDLVQDCFVTLWRKRESLKVTQSVESLLFVMLRNKCFNYLRDNKFLYSQINIQSVPEIDLQHLFELDFTGVEDKALEEELIEAIKAGVDKLPEKRKQVFIKSKIEGLKNREIAEQMDISLKMVEKHLKQAKDQIKNELLIKYPMFAILVSILLK